MNAYGCDGIADATVERELGLAGGVDENAVERELEDRAENEMRAGADAFRDWLVDYATANGGAGVALVCVVCGGLRLRDEFGRMIAREDSVQDYRDRIADARSAVERDYVAYRTGTATEAEREEIAASIRADREAA